MTVGGFIFLALGFTEKCEAWSKLGVNQQNPPVNAWLYLQLSKVVVITFWVWR